MLELIRDAGIPSRLRSDLPPDTLYQLHHIDRLGRKPMAASQRQINVRLPDESVRVLEAAAYVEGLSIAEFVRPHMDALVDKLREDEAVLTAVRLRVERVAEREGKLTQIGQRRRSQEKG